MKMYVLLRKDLKCPDGKKRRGFFIAQACHAVAEFLRHNPMCGHYFLDAQGIRGTWNGYMIILGINDGRELLRWESKLLRNYITHKAFSEPDLRNKKTAICCIAEDGFFDSLKLF